MLEKFVLALGTACSTIGIALQGMALASGPKQFAVQVVAIVCTGVGAGCLALSPKVGK